MQMNLPPIQGTPLYPTYFPTRMQTLIFRNWGTVDKIRLALVLKTTPEKVEEEAIRMGLLPQEDVSFWTERGYITIIRANWNILNYAQLKLLLDWTDEKLALILKEEDFLNHKLGNTKPDCPDITYAPLTEEELAQTAKIREQMAALHRANAHIPAKKAFCFSYLDKAPVKRTDTAKASLKVINQTGNTDLEEAVNRFLSEQAPYFEKAGQTYTLRLSYLPAKEEEYHEILIQGADITICGGGYAGILRGLYRLSDTISLTKDLLPEALHHKWTPQFDMRAIYPYSASYMNMLEDGAEVFLPDALLDEYARVGVNALWMPVLLYQLVEFPFAPEYSVGREKRLKNLQKIIRRAARYGIKIYLYLNEPRNMPVAIFQDRPQMKGLQRGENACLCVQDPEVTAYLTNGMETLCKSVPELGGFFFITQSENLTHCKSKPYQDGDIICEKCKDVPVHKLVQTVIAALSEGIRRGGPHMKAIFWDWAWKEIYHGFSPEQAEECIRSLPENTILMCQRESGIEICRGGVPVITGDYAISVDGLSPASVTRWRVARECGHETAVKLQINNTWECSAVPYIPVFKRLIEQLNTLKEEHIRHLFLSWTLGGHPSANIRMISEMFFTEDGKEADFTKSVESMYGADCDRIWTASERFSHAFGHYPFDIGFVYTGPANGGVANPFFETPTGRTATMTCYAYDGLDTWSKTYPPQVLENQLHMLCEEWKDGLTLLDGVEGEFTDMSKACYIQLKSAYYQIRFIRLRDKLIDLEKVTASAGSDNTKNITTLKQEILQIIRTEAQMAKEMYTLMLKWPEIGFEAANHYYFNIDAVMEKIVNLAYLEEYYS